jgi:hypothetical protein
MFIEPTIYNFKTMALRVAAGEATVSMQTTMQKTVPPSGGRARYVDKSEVLALETNLVGLTRLQRLHGKHQ